jgi:hypothetical protein
MKEILLVKKTSKYYKKLFGEPIQSNISLRGDDTEDIAQLSEEERTILTHPFSEEEFFEDISKMVINKAPGPDGFPVELYKTFWDVIKVDLMAMFAQFAELPLFKLNFGIITLLPEKQDASRIEQYRLICLLNVSFKVFTKVGTNRDTDIAQKVIRPTQSALIPGRNILEGVVVLHETIHEIHRKKWMG